MINTSTEFKQALSENGVCVSRASIILKNGTELALNDANIMQGGVKIDDGVSSSGHFDIGSAIINKLTLNLNNMYDEFSDYDFTDAVITVWTGKELAERTEWLKKGVFNADDPTATPSILTIEALDNMSKFDAYYDGKMSFPTTLQAIVQYCCTQCGVLLYNGQFPNYGYQISKNPFEGDNSNITYRALISYCALLAGCYVRCNADGRLELKWYDTTAFERIIDGGIFDQTTSTYYQTGDSLDGGNFTDYNSGNNADGGTFTENLPYHHIYSFSSLSVSTEDVVITGIRVKASDSEDSAGNKIEGETYLCGAEGYVLEVSGNPLIEAGKAHEVAEYLAGRVVGMRFRPFNASCIGDPSMEAGDAAIITDRKGNSYNTFLTNITYSTGNYANITCDAEPPARHSADRYSQIEQIVTDIKKDNQQKLSQYAQYVDQLNTLAINAMGYYETVEKQDDGSIIKYMHDKPLLSESKTVFKNSIDGFFWSHDGGKTWTMGVSKDGNAVMNVIAAIGISSEWIDTRGFKATDNAGNITFEIDANTGKVRIVADTFSLSGKSIQDIANGAVTVLDKKLTSNEVFNRLTDNGARGGIYMEGDQLYISFSYAKGGQLTLGGRNNGNGSLKMFDGSDKEIGAFDNSGVHLYKGEIAGPTLTVGGSGGKYGSVTVLGPNDVIRAELTKDSVSFYNKTGEEVGSINSDFYYGDGTDFTITNPSGSSRISLYSDGRTAINGKVDIGEKLQLNGGADRGLFIYAAEQSTQGWDAKLVEHGNYNFKLCRGTSSSKRYKDIGDEMTDGDVKSLYNITPVWARYKDGYLEESDERCGIEHPMFIAEDVEKYAPFAVDHDRDGRVENWNYRVMIPYMFQMIKGQKKELDELKLRLKEMEREIYGN